MSRAIRPGTARLVIVVLLAFVWLGSSFVGGYLLGQVHALAGDRRLTDLASRAAASVGIQAPVVTRSADSTLSSEEQARFKVFWEAWSLVNRDFYERAAIDSRKMTYGAVKGMVESLGDPHTAFSTPREKEMSDASLRGTFDGIGIQIDLRDGKLLVVAPIEGSPADQAGVRPGDVVTHVDGQELKGRALNETVLLIRGPRGTTVTLTISREGEAGPLTIPIQRAEIKLETVRSRLLEGDLGYVRITSFSATTGADTTAAVKRLVEQRPRGLVLDLRSNPGGYLQAAVDVASQFLGQGVVLYQHSASGTRQEYRAKTGGLATNLPVVVMIDKGSASASEIVAAALRDNGRAVLLGEKSYGKGSVQSVHTLSDSSGLRVTSAVWLTPNGSPLERQGLEPDLVVVSGSDSPPQSDQDVQLEAAVSYLRTAAATQTEQEQSALVKVSPTAQLSEPRP